MFLMFFAVAPDVMKHNGTNWNNDAAIASATIAMAHQLKLGVVAEGVENEQQLAFLRDRECDEFQGFLFSPAVPAEDFGRLLVEGEHDE